MKEKKNNENTWSPNAVELTGHSLSQWLSSRWEGMPNPQSSGASNALCEQQR